MHDTHHVHLAGRKLQGNQHVCAFFNSKDEEYRVMLPFLREGLAHGDCCFEVVDPNAGGEHRGRLQRAGIPLQEAEGSGQLQVLPWDQAYLRDGRFDLDRMIALCHEVFAANRAHGYPQTRLWANMEWGLQDAPGVHDLIAYESRLNQEIASFGGVVGVCTYDISRFSAATVMDVLRTHPLVIVGGVLQDNPFFTPHEQFMKELRERQ